MSTDEPAALGEPDDMVTAPWQQLSTRVAYQNKWIRVDEDIVRVPNGHETIYGIVRCSDAVGVLPFVDDDHVLLVQQYRYVAGHPTWEMPTGGRNSGESLEHAARRELAEEAGFVAGELTYLTRYHTSKSVVDEAAYLYVARDLTPGSQEADPTELFRRRVWKFDDVVQMVHRAEITDSMTVIAVLLVDAHRRGHHRGHHRRVDD
jgi:8-oxo-dGTP pyrophosphatase MutT (NUDIX family)